MIEIDGQLRLQSELCTIQSSRLVFELLEGESTTSCPSIIRFVSSLVLAWRLGPRDCGIELSKKLHKEVRV